MDFRRSTFLGPNYAGLLLHRWVMGGLTLWVEKFDGGSKFNDLEYAAQFNQFGPIKIIVIKAILLIKKNAMPIVG